MSVEHQQQQSSVEAVETQQQQQQQQQPDQSVGDDQESETATPVVAQPPDLLPLLPPQNGQDSSTATTITDAEVPAVSAAPIMAASTTTSAAVTAAAPLLQQLPEMTIAPINQDPSSSSTAQQMVTTTLMTAPPQQQQTQLMVNGGQEMVIGQTLQMPIGMDQNQQYAAASYVSYPQMPFQQYVPNYYVGQQYAPNGMMPPPGGDQNFVAPYPSIQMPPLQQQLQHPQQQQPDQMAPVLMQDPNAQPGGDQQDLHQIFANQPPTRRTRGVVEAGPSFTSTNYFARLWSLDRTRTYQVTMYPKIDRGFFMSEDDWTCYRRNYFQVTGCFSANDMSGNKVEVPCYVEEEGLLRTVTGFVMTVTARASNGNRDIELVQHTAKRDKGPQTHPLPRKCDPLDNPGTLSEEAYHAVTYERLQFKSATANNGKRRAAQQYHVLILELMAQCDDGTLVRLASIESVPLVVRGRAPGHYTGTSITLKPKDGKRSRRKKDDFGDGDSGGSDGEDDYGQGNGGDQQQQQFPMVPPDAQQQLQQQQPLQQLQHPQVQFDPSQMQGAPGMSSTPGYTYAYSTPHPSDPTGATMVHYYQPVAPTGMGIPNTQGMQQAYYDPNQLWQQSAPLMTDASGQTVVAVQPGGPGDLGQQTLQLDPNQVVQAQTTQLAPITNLNTAGILHAGAEQGYQALPGIDAMGNPTYIMYNNGGQAMQPAPTQYMGGGVDYLNGGAQQQAQQPQFAAYQYQFPTMSVGVGEGMMLQGGGYAQTMTDAAGNIVALQPQQMVAQDPQAYMTQGMVNVGVPQIAVGMTGGQGGGMQQVPQGSVSVQEVGENGAESPTKGKKRGRGKKGGAADEEAKSPKGKRGKKSAAGGLSEA